MDETAIAQYLATSLPGVQNERNDGNWFFFAGSERNFPFATLVAKDSYDKASNLGRPGVFRLNIGVSRETFRGLFPKAGSASCDFAALDTIMPHPVYGSMFWVCVLNPGAGTWEKARPLLDEAHALAEARQSRRTP